ncbi:MAG: hypothetical protein M3076_12805 [Actinomycetota bacterium]|nr:hypothetical protein [Actinomycetota bacterium]
MRRLRLAGVAMVIVGALLLFGSLFLTWSHQFSTAVLAQWGASPVLAGIPRNPTAWQLYSATDVLLAVLAVALPIVAFAGRRRGRLVILAAAGVALAFVIHALNVPPTNRATFFEAAVHVPTMPMAGAGEAVAAAGLGTAIIGLLLTLGAR